MTNGTTPKPYLHDNPRAYLWTENAYDALEAERMQARVVRRQGVLVADVSGECPYCGDELGLDPIVLTAATTGARTLGETAAGAGEDFVRVPIACACAVSHPGAPQNAEGCGVEFAVEVLAEEETG